MLCTWQEEDLKQQLEISQREEELAKVLADKEAEAKANKDKVPSSKHHASEFRKRRRASPLLQGRSMHIEHAYMTNVQHSKR